MFGSTTRITGLFTGMDTQSMVSQIMRAETMRLTRFQQRRQLVVWRQEMYREAASTLRNFQSQAIGLTSNLSVRLPSTFETMRVSAQTSAGNTTTAVRTSLTSDAKVGSFSVDVKQVAQTDMYLGNSVYSTNNNTSHTLNSTNVNTLTLQQLGMTNGNTPVTISITNNQGQPWTREFAANRTLQSVMDEINDFRHPGPNNNTPGNDLGVKMYFDSLRGRVVLESTQTGKDNAINFDRLSDTGNFFGKLGFTQRISGSYSNPGTVTGDPLDLGVKNYVYKHDLSGALGGTGINGSDALEDIMLMTQGYATALPQPDGMGTLLSDLVNNIDDYVNADGDIEFTLNGGPIKLVGVDPAEAEIGDLFKALNDNAVVTGVQFYHDASTNSLIAVGGITSGTETDDIFDVFQTPVEGAIMNIGGERFFFTGDMSLNAAFAEISERPGVNFTLDIDTDSMLTIATNTETPINFADLGDIVGDFWEVLELVGGTATPPTPENPPVYNEIKVTIGGDTITLTHDMSFENAVKAIYDAIKDAQDSQKEVLPSDLAALPPAIREIFAQNYTAPSYDTANRIQTAQDLKFIYNGQNTPDAIIERSTNNVLIEGVNVTFTHAAVTQETITVSVGRDTSRALEGINNFITEYNKLVDYINDLTRTERPRSNNSYFEPLTDEQKRGMSEREIDMWEERAKTGLLHRDDLLNNILTQMRRTLFDPVRHVNDDGTSVNRFLTQIGISTSQDRSKPGHLVIFDEARLTRMLEEDPDFVKNIFTSTRYQDDDGEWHSTALGIADRMHNIIEDALAFNGAITRRAGSDTNINSTMARTIENYDNRINDTIKWLIRRENYYYDMFAKMEAAMMRAESQMGAIMGMFQ